MSKKKLLWVLMLASLVFFTTGCTALFFQPVKPHALSLDDYDISYQNVFFKSTDDVMLHGWWLPSEKSKAVVIFLQGNTGNISMQVAGAYWLTKHNYDVFIFDYRGYGKSEGVAYLQGVLNDISQSVVYAGEKSGNKKVFVIGQSLGASMGAFAITKVKDQVDGVIFVSPFSDYRDIAQDMLSKSKITWAFQWPLSFTINNDYRPLNFVSDLSPIPTLFVYSENDEVVPPSQTIELFEKAHLPKNIEMVEGTHNSILGIQENRDVIVKYLDDWLDL